MKKSVKVLFNKKYNVYVYVVDVDLLGEVGQLNCRLNNKHYLYYIVVLFTFPTCFSLNLIRYDKR